MGIFSRNVRPLVDQSIQADPVVTPDDYLAMAEQIVTLYRHMTSQLALVQGVQEQFAELETRVLEMQDQLNSFKARLPG